MEYYLGSFIALFLLTIVPLLLILGVVVFIVIYLVKTFKPYLDDYINAKHDKR